MQDITSVLTKFKETPGMCTMSELRKIIQFSTSLIPKIMKFEKATGEFPTQKKLNALIKDASFCFDNHENKPQK